MEAAITVVFFTYIVFVFWAFMNLGHKTALAAIAVVSLTIAAKFALWVHYL